jgi:hypothetical protein
MVLLALPLMHLLRRRDERLGLWPPERESAAPHKLCSRASI